MHGRILCLIFCVTLAGCTDSNPEAAKQFVVDNAPDPVVPMKDVKDRLTESELNEPVRVVGRIYAGPDSTPWEEGQAAFLLADTSDGDTDHDPFGCPYCSRHIEDYQAYVSFRDDQQELISTDARKLFGVAEKQLVVVEGTASLSSDGFLLINATKLFIAPEDWRLEKEKPADTGSKPPTAENAGNDDDSSASDQSAATDSQVPSPVTAT